MGVFLGASTPIINRDTGELTYGRIPAYSVVISGTRPGKPLPDGSQGPSLICAVIVKQVDAGTRSKTAISDLCFGHKDNGNRALVSTDHHMCAAPFGCRANPDELDAVG